MREIDPWGWMFHIDGDEVLHLDKERLQTLADDIEAVQLSPARVGDAHRLSA